MEYASAARAAEGALERVWSQRDFGGAGGPGRRLSSAECRQNMLETLCRLRLQAAALGARLPPDLASRWPDFARWFQRRQERDKGEGISDWWLTHFLNPWGKKIRAKPQAFVHWVRHEMAGMAMPASALRL